MNFDCHAFKLHLWTTNDAWTMGFSSILVSCFFVFSLIRGLKVFCSDSWFFEGEGFWAGFKVDLVIDGVSWKWDVCFRFYYRVSRDGYIWNFETIDFSLKFLLSLFFLLIKFENFAKLQSLIYLLYFFGKFLRFVSFHSTISDYILHKYFPLYRPSILFDQWKSTARLIHAIQPATTCNR